VHQEAQVKKKLIITSIIIITLATAAIILTLILGGTTSSPSVIACTHAMTTQLTYAEAHPGTGSTMGEPTACAGLSTQQLQAIAAQVTANSLNKLVGG
jgi:hypothetical protein